MDGSNITRLFPQREVACEDDGGTTSGSNGTVDADRVPIRITRLEMTTPPTRSVPMPGTKGLGLLRLREVPVAFYTYLFESVGRDHHWRLPPDEGEAELDAYLNSSDCEVHVLYVGGAPAGFFELDARKRSEAVVIACFGILPHARGRGLARWFLSEAIRAAWQLDPPRVRLQTNNYDSPIALRLYQQLGFEVTGSKDGYLILGDGR